MLLKELYLLNFKNYTEKNWLFSPKLNLIVGENGTGKTNLLDAVYFLCLSKSAFGSTDQNLIRHGEMQSVLRGFFEKKGENFEIACGLQAGKTKILKCNKQTYSKIADHIGKFICVLIHPYDTDLIREGSEIRRKFFDQMICQVDSVYLEHLVSYNHVLKQRNSLLKQFAERHFFDQTLLEQYDSQVMELGKLIFEKRQFFVQKFVPEVLKQYQYIAESKESAHIEYESDWQEANWKINFTQARQKDLALQRTTVGVHKDDYAFQLDGFSVDKFGSQGQQKSFVIALKLAQFALMQRLTQEQPILLLDDIFDKLDANRIGKMIQMIENQCFGQVFVTDAQPQRSLDFFEKIEEKAIFETAVL